MNTKIYVGNLLYEVTDDELRQLFAPYGDVVTAEVVRYKKSRRSKGFGYVKMGNTDQAQNAITALNDQDYRGRRLFLQPARSDDPPAEVMQDIQQSAQEQVPETAPEAAIAHEAQSAQETHVEQQAQQEYVEQQNYTQMQPEESQAPEEQVAIETVPDHVQTPEPQTPQPVNEGIGRSGTIFSGGGDRSNNT